MIFKFVTAFITLLFCSFSFANEAEDAAIASSEYEVWARGVWESLDRRTGSIPLSELGATLNVPEEFYFLGAEDAEKVLVEIWGNPPGQEVLGMLLPATHTPFDADSWAVTIEYEQDGYVSDEDAEEIDYAELLEQMKQDTALASEERESQGYESIELVGWAAEPFYDIETHKLHWAKELKFGGGDVHTLNYNIRVLGRRGVMVLNFIAGMDQQPMIESNLDTVLALAEFDSGSRYADFNPDIDEVAAYGLGALVAGKVIAKTGFLALALVFLKKFGVFIVVGLGVLFKNIFGKKKTNAGNGN